MVQCNLETCTEMDDDPNIRFKRQARINQDHRLVGAWESQNFWHFYEKNYHKLAKQTV